MFLKPQSPSFSPPATWSIAAVERDTGLGKDTLRVWERRYGFPTPVRDAVGERLYPQEQVSRLRLVKRALDAGFRPGKVVKMAALQLQDLLSGQTQAGGEAKQVRGEAKQALDEASASPVLAQASPWLGWLADDRTDLIRQALRQHILKRGLGVTVDELVAPLCVYVGEAWMRGELSVYQEHLFTQTLQTVLREATASIESNAQTQDGRPRVLFTTTPGEQHALGLLMAECYFALESCARFELGVSTPIVDILHAVQKLRIDVLALSFSAHAARRDMRTALAQLQAGLPQGVEIWVGGAAAATNTHLLPPGLTVVKRAKDVARLVQDWRARNP